MAGAAALESALDKLGTAPAEGTAQLKRWIKELLQARRLAMLPAPQTLIRRVASSHAETPVVLLQDKLCGSRTLPPSAWLVVKAMAKAYPLLLHKEYDVALAEAAAAEGEELRLDAWVLLVGRARWGPGGVGGRRWGLTHNRSNETQAAPHGERALSEAHAAAATFLHALHVCMCCMHGGPVCAPSTDRPRPRRPAPTSCRLSTAAQSAPSS